MQDISQLIHRAGAQRALAIGLIAALGGCSHSIGTSSTSGAAPGGSGATAPSARTPLALSRSTYDVAMKPDARVIDASTMTKAYRGTGADGALKFDAAVAPDIAALKPGTVTVFAGTALLRVTRVESSGGTVSVTGTPAGLEDAIDRGHIAWSAPLNFNKMAFNPPPGFHRVMADPAPRFALENILGRPAQASVDLSANTWNGMVKDWDVTIALTPTGGSLHLDLHATKQIGGGTIDLHGSGQFDGLTNQTSITLANGSTTEIEFDNNGLRGTVDFAWKVAFDADHGGGNPKLSETDVENLPFSLELPIPAGPIPFVLTFKTGFAFAPSFSSKVAVAQGSYHGSFGGDLPMTDTASNDVTGSASAATPAAPDNGGGSVTGEGTINSYGGTASLAAIGLSTTVALPKIGLTIGLPAGLSSVLGVDLDAGGPYATIMTQANFLATGTLTIVQCEKRELNLLAVVGYKPGLLGKLNLKPVSKTILEKNFTEIRPPNITLCNH